MSDSSAALNVFTVPALLSATVPSREEEFHILHETSQVRIERISSHGQATPPDFWYDQPEDEWVLLVRGEAILRYEDEPPVPLQAGSHHLIPRHRKHRVESTSQDALWLAVHLKDGAVK